MIAYAAPSAADSTMVANPVQMATMMRAGSPMSHFAPHTADRASFIENGCLGAPASQPCRAPHKPTTITQQPQRRVHKLARQGIQHHIDRTELPSELQRPRRPDPILRQPHRPSDLRC